MPPRCRRKPTAAPEKPKRKWGETLRKKALKRGVLCKARKPFALFTAEQMTEKYKGRPFTECMKAISKAWRELSDQGKEPYRRRSTEEYARQHDKLGRLGLCRRLGGVTPSPPPSDGVAVGGVPPAMVVSLDRPAETPRQMSVHVRYGPWAVNPKADTLAKGAFGLVLEASHEKSQRRAALKLFSHDVAKEGAREVKIYADLWNKAADPDTTAPLFLPLLGWGTAPLPWLALPIVVLGGLTSVLSRKCSENTKAAIVYQVQAALMWLHAHRILHLDLKPSNVVWDDVNRAAYLIDFGMAEVTSANSTHPEALHHSTYTTAMYRAPELWPRPAPRKTDVTAKCDVWSFGCFVFEVWSDGAMLMFPGQNCNGSDAERKAFEVMSSWCERWNRAGKGVSDKWLRTMLRIPEPWRALTWLCCAPGKGQRPMLVDHQDVGALAPVFQVRQVGGVTPPAVAGDGTCGEGRGVTPPAVA